MADEFDFSDTSWLDDLDETTNLDFSYDPSTAGIFSFNPDDMVFDDIFNVDAPSFSGDYDQYFADSGDWLTDLEQSLDNPFDFSYDPFDPTDPEDSWEWNSDSLGDPTNFLKEQYPDLYPEEIEFGELEFGEPNWLETILGFVGGKRGKNRAQGIMSGVGGGITDFANSTIGQLLLANYLKNKDKEDRKIPLGAEAYGDQGLGSMPDYRIFNLQPALMPGVGYANAPPPEMKHGGLASLDQGPGDITLARLEPGEFVMTRKATDNIGAKNLYRLMKEAERMG